MIDIDTDARTVTVRTQHGVEILGYDALVLAPGAVAVRPPLPGWDSPRVHTLRTVPDALALRDAVTDGVRRAVVRVSSVWRRRRRWRGRGCRSA
ncbi:MAG TPA: FAD-dependent oxidoreductase [Jiangellales bacterium]|nr:FAD-dependent oxidoreductase [Jiangellales bacterium]